MIQQLYDLFPSQIYLKKLYKARFSAAFYGLLRISKVAQGPHYLRARDVHVGMNKDKILLVLHSLKTHSRGTFPQTIKISGIKSYSNTKHCPFALIRQYVQLRKLVTEHDDPFFIFKDGSPIKAYLMNKTLKLCLKNLNFQHHLYSFHSLRSGRATSLMESGMSVESIKKVGRWKSNVVYHYLQF